MGFHTCGPNAALVKSGAGHRKPVIVSGGYVWAWPIIQKVQRLDLRIMTLDIKSPHVYTKQGVPVTVLSIAQVKLSRNAESLGYAAGQFLGMSRQDIMHAADETLEGHQRAILGGLTVEEIFQDREKFATEVLHTAGVDLGAMGMEIVSFTIKDVSDDHEYLNSLGKKRTAEVKRDARIGEAEAERDAGMREAQATREKMQKKYEAETAVADSQRKFELQKAAFDSEVNAEKAKAQLAGDLQKAKTRQEIKKEAMQVDVIVRAKKIEVEEQEIKRKERELEAKVKRPALADRYKMEQEAEGARNATFAKADGTAQAITAKGTAEAFVIQKMGEAEAQAMALKADAWKQYTSGAYLEMIITRLPEMAHAVSDALSQAKEITFVSTGGQDVGASRLTGEVVNVMTQVAPMVRNLTGIDVPRTLARLREQEAAE